MVGRLVGVMVGSAVGARVGGFWRMVTSPGTKTISVTLAFVKAVAFVAAAMDCRVVEYDPDATADTIDEFKAFFVLSIKVWFELGGRVTDTLTTICTLVVAVLPESRRLEGPLTTVPSALTHFQKEASCAVVICFVAVTTATTLF